MQEAPREKTTAVKWTQAARKVRGITKEIYTRAHEAKAQGKPVAYCMGGCMYSEILLAMDITPVWTENYAGLCAAKRDAERFLLKAESEGYSNVICGYARTGIGFDAMRSELRETPPAAPDGGMPEPDMLLGCSAGCDPRFKWYQSLGRYKATPVYSLDVVTPPTDANLAQVGPYYVAYQVEEFKDLIAFLEKQTGKKMDYDKLSHHLAISDETYQVWWETDQLRKAIPCPMPSEDHFNIFVPGLFRLGEPETLNFYRELYAEVKERVDNKIGVIPEEKYRLMWAGGLPPWHTMWMFNYFESKKAVFAIENAYLHWAPMDIPVGVEQPLEHLAWRTFRVVTRRYEQAQKASGYPDVELVRDAVKDYHIDGMVMHATRSCRAMTIGQIFLRDRIQEYAMIPTLFLISDIVDLRDYSEAQWRMQIDAFMETIGARRTHR